MLSGALLIVVSTSFMHKGFSKLRYGETIRHMYLLGYSHTDTIVYQLSIVPALKYIISLKLFRTTFVGPPLNCFPKITLIRLNSLHCSSSDNNSYYSKNEIHAWDKSECGYERSHYDTRKSRVEDVTECIRCINRMLRHSTPRFLMPNSSSEMVAIC